MTPFHRLGAVLSLLAMTATATADTRFVRFVGSTSNRPVVVSGFSCGQSFHVQNQVHHQQAYVAPHAPHVVHHQQHHDVHALPVIVNPDYIFSVNDALRDKLIVDAVVGRLAPLFSQQQAQLNQLQLQVLTNGQPPAGAIPPTAPRLPPASKPGIIGDRPQAVGPAGDALGYAGKPELAALFAEKCTRCHGDSGIVKGKLDLRDLAKLTGEQWGRVYEDCESGDMPKDDTPLTAEQFNLVRAEVKAARSAARK